MLALAAGDGDVSLPALTVIELICDWRNMTAEAKRAGGDGGR